MNWLVKSNSSKRKLVTLHPHGADAEFSSVMRNDYTLKEVHCLKRNAKGAGKMFGSVTALILQEPDRIKNAGGSPC